MTFQAAYNIASAAAILWVACVWSGKGGVNILLKSLFILLSFTGAVMVARSLGL